MTHEHMVVVGVDGSPSAWQALDWAAEIADRSGRQLLVVHVGDTAPDGRTADPRPFGRILLEDSVAWLVDSRPGLDATAELVSGEPAAVLLQMSATADLVAVGRGRHGLPGLALGSVANKVLGRAQCPTAVVPEARRAPSNTIVVGASDSPGGRTAMRFAVAEASRRDADVVAVRSWSDHQWRLAASAALPVSDTGVWEDAERAVLEECVRRGHDAFPSTRVRPVLTGTPTEIALERESADALMLVLGCRRAEDARLPRLGPVASWAAHHLDCPVVVVGHPARDRVPDLDSAADVAALPRP